MKNNKQTLAYLAATFAILLWSSAFPITRYVLQYYSPVTIVLLRFTAASVTLIIIGIIRKIRLPALKDIPLFALCGLSGVFIYSYLFNTGSVTVVAGVSSFIITSSPVYTLILTRLILKEKVKLICWIGVGVSFIGLGAVTLSQTTEFALNSGVFLLILAAISSGVWTIVVRKLSTKKPEQEASTKPYNAMEITTYAITSGTIGMLIFIPSAIREIPDSLLTVNLLVIFLGIFPSAFGYLAYGYALASAAKVAHITVFQYLIPFFSALIAYFWLGETLTMSALIGGIIIIIGMIITNLTGKR